MKVNRRTRMGLGVMLFIALGFSSCNQQEEANPNEVEAETTSIADISTGKLEKRYMSSDLSAVGQLESPPQNKVSLSVPMGATAREVHYHVGEEVRKGAVLAVFAHPDLIEVQREFIKAKSRFERSELEWNRIKNLYESDATSEREYETTRSRFNEAKADLDALRSKVVFLGYDAETILSKGIQEHLNLISPIDGYISEIRVNPGMYLEANKVAYELINRSELFISLRLYGAQLAQVQKGDTMRYTLSGDPKTYTGEVMAVAPTVSDEQTAEVHAHLDEVPEYFRSGMHVSAVIELQGDTAWTVPNEAIWREGNQTFMFELVDSTYHRREVQIGRKLEGFTEIIEMHDATGFTDRLWALDRVYYLNAQNAL